MLLIYYSGVCHLVTLCVLQQITGLLLRKKWRVGEERSWRALPIGVNAIFNFGLADFQCVAHSEVLLSKLFADGLGDYYFQGGRNANEGGRSPTLLTC